MALPKPESSSPGTFSRDVLTLVSGTTFAQVITILSTPVITRLFGPEAFGLLALFTTIVGIVTIAACLRYELAIMLPKSDEEAVNVFGLCLVILVIISLLSVPVILLTHTFIEQSLRAPQIGPFLWLIPPMIFLSGAFLALNYWNTRTRQFYRLAIAQMMRSCSTTGTQLGMGIFGFASGGVLVGASVLGQFVSTVVLGIQILRDHYSYFRKNITREGMLAAFREYRNFPKYDLWSALLNNISSTLPIFVLSMYFTSATLGFYSLGLMVLQLPLNLIGNAIGQVFFQKAAETKNISPQKFRDTVESTLKPLILLAFFPTLVFILIGPQLFGVVFGNKWLEAGNYARYLSVWIAVAFVVSPINSIINIFQKQKFGLIINITQIVFRIVALLVGAIFGSALLAIVLFSLVGVITNIIPLLYMFRLSDIPFVKPAKILLEYCLLSIPFGIMIMLIQYAGFISNLELVVVTFLFTVGYYVLAIRRDPEMFRLLKSVISQVPVLKRCFP